MGKESGWKTGNNNINRSCGKKSFWPQKIMNVALVMPFPFPNCHDD